MALKPAVHVHLQVTKAHVCCTGFRPDVQLPGRANFASWQKLSRESYGHLGGLPLRCLRHLRALSQAGSAVPAGPGEPGFLVQPCAQAIR